MWGFQSFCCSLYGPSLSLVTVHLYMSSASWNTCDSLTCSALLILKKYWNCTSISSAKIQPFRQNTWEHRQLLTLVCQIDLTFTSLCWSSLHLYLQLSVVCKILLMVRGKLSKWCLKHIRNYFLHIRCFWRDVARLMYNILGPLTLHRTTGSAVWYFPTKAWFPQFIDW